jgi:hypothetical protein
MGLKEFFYNLNGLSSDLIPGIPAFQAHGINSLPLKDL